MVLATGQISLTDLNDTKQYILYLNGAHKTQIFDPNAGTYTPNFGTTNLDITPELYVSGGTGENLVPSANVKSVLWYEGTNTTTPLTETAAGTTADGLTYAIPTGSVGTTNKTLTLKSNLTSMNNKAFTCVITYMDPQTNFDITIKALYEIVKITNGQKGVDGSDGEDGANGEDAYYLNLWAPNGDTIRNSNGTILLQSDLYKGSGVVTPTAFKWYIQNPQASGDSDSGAGWELLTSTNTHGTSGYTTAKLTVPATAIAGVEGFMSIATAPGTGTKYNGVIITRDFQDPIVVNIVGTSIFKNGVGSVNLTAQLIQAGSEIPTTGYTFDWALYNSDGSLNKTYSEDGPSITVPASDVNGTANLVVDVTK